MRQFEFHYFPVRKIIQEETIESIFPLHFPEVDIPTNSPQYTSQSEQDQVSVLNLKIHDCTLLKDRTNDSLKKKERKKEKGARTHHDSF